MTTSLRLRIAALALLTLLMAARATHSADVEAPPAAPRGHIERAPNRGPSLAIVHNHHYVN